VTEPDPSSPNQSRAGNVAGVSRELGARLRRLRVDRGLTQAQLAGTRLSESYVSLIESGRRSPTDEVVAYLAASLGCSVEALTGGAGLPDAATAEMLIRRGEWETNSGSPSQATEHLHAGVELARQLGLTALAARGRLAMARALEVDGRLRDAIGLWEELLEESARNPRDVSAVAVTVGLSRCCRELGELDRAIEVGELYWATADKHHLGGDIAGEDTVVVGATLLSAYLETGNQGRCRELADELVALAETVNTPMATGAPYWNAALAAEADGRVAEALRLAEQAQARMSLTQDVRNRARLQIVLGGLHLRTQPPDTTEAVRLLLAAEPVLEQFGSTVDIGYCRTELARAHLQNHDYHRAQELAKTTIADLNRSGEAPLELARTLMVLASAESALGRTTSARKNVRRAAEHLEHAGATRQAASRWTELAELSVQLGEPTAAIEAFRKATELLGAKRTTGAPEHSRRSLNHDTDSSQVG
jgi:transcriptional regulator with XRE-family HTH domain